MCFCVGLFTLPFKSKIRLEAENAIPRHQLIVLERKMQRRVRSTNSDRLFFIRLYCWIPSMLDALRIIRPETLVRTGRIILHLILGGFVPPIFPNLSFRYTQVRIA
jgi:hypothetical protein